MWRGQIKFVQFALIIGNLEAVNYHHQVIQFEPLEVWCHRGFVSVLVSVVLLPLLVLTVILLFISSGKLWIMIIFLVITFFVFPVYDQFEYFQDIVHCFRLLLA